MNKVCYNCKYENLKATEEPCKYCTGDVGSQNKWEEKHCTDCVFFLKRYDEEPCEFCCGDVNKPKFKLQGREETEANSSEQEVKSCFDCKYFSKDIDEEPCCGCLCVNKGDHSYWKARKDEPQTAREIVEKAVKQHLQEEHYDEHYHDKVQPLEIMQEIMTPEEFKGFLFGNIIKYICRCGKKDEPQKEFAKLRRYREWYDMAVMGRHIDPRI